MRLVDVNGSFSLPSSFFFLMAIHIVYVFQDTEKASQFGETVLKWLIIPKDLSLLYGY